ncbi:MAG: hypothetical protein M3P48_08410, partial [Actinomycetota bacterium]|nr:hypothetical protein [Actinomycetota bacterium]
VQVLARRRRVGVLERRSLLTYGVQDTAAGAVTALRRIARPGEWEVWQARALVPPGRVEVAKRLAREHFAAPSRENGAAGVVWQTVQLELDIAANAPAVAGAGGWIWQHRPSRREPDRCEPVHRRAAMQAG